MAGYGLIELPQVLEHFTKVAVRLGEVGFDGEGLGDEINGNVVLSLLMGDDAEQMPGDRLTRISLQNLLINALGLRQTARRVVLQCACEFVLGGSIRLVGSAVFCLPRLGALGCFLGVIHWRCFSAPVPIGINHKP